MAVAFDASILVDLLDPRVRGDRRERLDFLVAELQKKRTKILIPTPALTELMIRAGKAREAIHQKLSVKSPFQIVPFDSRAAMECALLLEEALNTGERKQVSKTKFKFDWQIVAIAASHNATVIYSDDGDISRYGLRANLKVIKTDDLPLPASALQGKLEFP
ncbi:MAG: PIN domain-containing protein [Nitrosomonadales bacterium]|nr:PIN domain-containing protein [Nitrosomonadales bacterium]